MKNKYNLILIGCMLFILSLGITYAAFSENLYVVGSAKTYAYLWPSGVLPGTPVTTSSGISFGTQSKYLSGSATNTNASKRFDTLSESYNNDTSTYQATIGKKYTALQQWISASSTISLTYTFTNMSNYVLTNGAVTVSAVKEHSYNGLNTSSVTGTLDKTTLNPGESATLTMSLPFQAVMGLYSGNYMKEHAYYDITYVGGNNETMHMYVKLDFVGHN